MTIPSNIKIRSEKTIFELKNCKYKKNSIKVLKLYSNKKIPVKKFLIKQFKI